MTRKLLAGAPPAAVSTHKLCPGITRPRIFAQCTITSRMSPDLSELGADEDEEKTAPRCHDAR